MINTVILTGRLVSEPELKKTSNDLSVLAFTVAVNRNKEVTDYIDCIAWRQQADLIQKYFNKGGMIGIEGNLQSRNWETKEGQKRKSIEVTVSKIHFMENKKNEEKPQEDNDELPF